MPVATSSYRSLLTKRELITPVWRWADMHDVHAAASSLREATISLCDFAGRRPDPAPAAVEKSINIEPLTGVTFCVRAGEAARLARGQKAG